MQVEQEVGEFRPWQDVLLDPALRPDEVGTDARIQSYERAGDRQPGIEVSAGAARGERHRDLVTRGHAQAGLGPRARGSVAPLPITRSFVLPIFTRTPVRNIVSTMLERPYETKGSVRPVVGRSPITTPMWRYAVITVTK